MDSLDFVNKYGTVIGCASITVAFTLYLLLGAWHRERAKEQRFEAYLKGRRKVVEATTSRSGKSAHAKEAGDEQSK